MGGNDLNLKKSWHPQLMSNQRRVYEAEQAALQERKLTEARLEEIRRERQIEETQKQLEASGGPKRVDRVDWMYQGPTDGGRDEYSSEAFLLGKRRIDSILRGDDAKKVEKTAGPTGEAPAPLSTVASARDTAAKIREDPLVAIKRQEQEAYQTMMKDPTKRRQLLAQMGIADEDSKPKRKHDRHRSHRSHRRHRDDDSDYERRHRRPREVSRNRSRSPRRHDNDSDSDSDRRRKRRRSDSRDRTPPRRRYGDDSDDERQRKSRRSDSVDRSRGARRYDDGSDYEIHRKTRESASLDKSRDRRRHDPDDKYRSNGRRDATDRRRHENSIHREDRRSDNRDDEEERLRKLAAMQNDASDLDKAREARLAALAEKERVEREADDRARAKASKYGGREFANRLHNSAGNESLADRIGRGRQGLQRDDD